MNRPGRSTHGHPDSTIPHQEPADGTTVLEMAQLGEPKRVKRLLKVIGPGLITGASDDDPSGIGTYSITGAQFGYAFLWTAPWCFPLMASVQYICAKVGMVSGRGLAGVLRHNYPGWVLYPAVFLLVVANTINAGADIGAIAAAINLLVPVPIAWMIVPIALGIVVLQIWGSYKVIAGTFKWLCIALFAYVAAGLLARPNLIEVLRATIVPTIEFNASFATTLVAILGTTISPYLFFWQASQEVEEEIQLGRHSLWARAGATDRELKYRAWDVNIGMGIAIVVMYFIMLATGSTLNKVGQTNIQSAADAAVALRPLAGDLAELLLAVGLIGTGVLAVPVLTGSAAYAICESVGWRSGLDEKPGRARQFYAVIGAATLVGMGINFLGINPIDALFYTAVINGLLAPPLLVVIMLVSNNRQIMGNRTNNRWINLGGWAATGLMSAAAIVLLFTLGKGS
ncbi:MAG: divalent metal cation transporter [Chloroflexi bacterium]|nr:divalent metal cation transporter [Chloroflexota bacterium]